MNKISNKQLGPLDEIRGLAALAVFVIHFIQLYYKTSDLGWVGTIADLLGTWGVSIFFILSGFLIHTGSLREFSLNQSVSWKKYYTRRFFRIYPPYVICLIASFLVGIFFQTSMITKADIGNLLAHITLTSTFFTHYFESINAIFWTVIVEVHFYILYPLLWWLLRKQSIWVIFSLTFFLGLVYFVVAYKFTDAGMQRVMQQHTTLVLFWKWVLGIVLAEIYWNKRPAFLLKIFNIKGLIFPLIIASFIPEIFLNDSIALQYARFVMPFISFIVIGVLLSDNIKYVSNEIFKWVGKVSYSLYLWHPLVLLFGALLFENGGVICFLVLLIISLAVAWVSYITTEVTSMNWGKNINK